MKNNKYFIGFKNALIFSVVYAVLFKLIQTGNPFQPSTVIMATIVLLCTLIISRLGNKLLKYNYNVPAKELRRKVVPSFLLFVFLTIIIGLSIVIVVLFITHVIVGSGSNGSFIKTLVQRELLPTFITLFFWILITAIFYFYKIWSQAIEREQQVKEENLIYKYRNLKTQLNPHFLFNSLNTLSEIIYTDTQKADNYIQKLSGMYRYILENEETDFIPLDQEIEFVKQYFELQKERAENKIRLHIQIENTDRYKIIPISLQVLVENALKHNSASEEKPLEITIYNTNDHIVVSNTLQKKNVLNNSIGTGLDNLRERVKLITGKEMTISEENNQFIVSLPLINI